ncbi:MAG: 3'(2'),5'-bisphosphate nucleotidase CysQ [Pseudomonadota bacterium]
MTSPVSPFAPVSKEIRVQLLEALEPIARQAGAAIMEVYGAMMESDELVARTKGDGSPVTEADEKAEAIILAGLQECAPQIPIVSEENAASHAMAAPEQFWLVDPLDGTKEFLKGDGKGSFTVNVALIENGTPVLGIVHAPALDRCFKGAVGLGATENGETIAVRPVPEDGCVAVASLSHRDAQTDEWLSAWGITQTRSIGSSLKFCLLACGDADVYPRFGPTMEWDTGAGHAVLAAAGGSVEHPDGRAFDYGKTDFRNGPFVARGSFEA